LFGSLKRHQEIAIVDIVEMAEHTVTAQTGAILHPDMEKMASRHSASNPPPEFLTGEADAELLGKPIASIGIGQR
jgi:hypothetical protein